MYKSELPRQSDLVHSILRLLSTSQAAELVKCMVLDAEDAYWQVPLHPRERRHYCFKLIMPDGRVRFMVFLMTPQGSAGAPMSWAIEFGLVCRLVVSVIRDPVIPDSSEMQVYVDDPVTALRGTEEAITENAALAIIGWALCGVKLAFRKGQFGQ